MAELTLTGMRVVREVGLRGSFTEAARTLGYTQSGISRQVGLAERALGFELFERLPRGVRATPRGAILLRRVAQILERLDSALLELEELAEPLRERLVLGAFPTALAALVPRALLQVKAEHPALALRVREGGSEAQLRRLRAGHIAIAVIAVGAGLEYDLADLEVDQLLQGTPRVIVSTGHRLADRTWVNVAELRDEPWIVGEADRSGPQFGPWPALDGEPEVAYVLRDWVARIGMVAAGLGVAVVPSLFLPALPAEVCALRVEDPRPYRRRVLAATQPARSPSVQAVIGALQGEAARFG